MVFSKPLFQPIKKRRSFEDVCDAIKRLLFDGTLKPGDKLPSENQLASQFNVARQTIREALRLLELSGFIAIKKGGTGGPIITNTILNSASSSLLDAIQMKTVTIDELIEARREIERLIMNRVIINADQSEIENIKKNILEARKTIEAGVQAFSENVSFHSLLAKASKNQIFSIVIDAIMAVVADFLSRGAPDIEASKQQIDEHEALLNALIEKNYDKAISLLDRHLINVRYLLKTAEHRTDK